jgi:SAM-dependent methyltransferase
MNEQFLDLFLEDSLKYALIENGIPRFTPNISYSTGNFSKLRELHTTLQLDSINGTDDRRSTVFNNTGWPESFFKNKVILECGCGAGPDTEILLSLGAKVMAVDIAGLDIAQKNLRNNPNLQLVQASIEDLPFKRKSFDIVFCHRVIQHTPHPAKVLSHILEFVKDDGAVFVHSYAATFAQYCSWKYFLRPLTKRLDPEKLYGTIKLLSIPLYNLSGVINKFGKFGKYFNHVFIPFKNYGNEPRYNDKSKDFIIEYGIHDTFDALSPRFDRPLRSKLMEEIARRKLNMPFLIRKEPRSTYLVSKV